MKRFGRHGTVAILCSWGMLASAGHAMAARAAPVPVAPLSDGSTRYEVPHFQNQCEQNGGCIVAYDETTGAVRWWQKVYCTHYESTRETDVQDVFITSIAQGDAGLEISDEKGRHFILNTTTLAVSGDANGCGESSGCSLGSVRGRGPAAPAALAVAFGCLLGIAAWRRRRHPR